MSGVSNAQQYQMITSFLHCMKRKQMLSRTASTAGYDEEKKKRVEATAHISHLFSRDVEAHFFSSTSFVLSYYACPHHGFFQFPDPN